MNDATRFPGVWRLISYELRHFDGSVTLPLGERPVGRLIYDEHGRMSGQIMRRDRPRFAPGSGTERTAGAQAAFESYVAYFGSYHVEQDRGVIIHHVEGSLYPNWVGGDQERKYEFEGDRLTLLARVGKEGTGVLIWERDLSPSDSFC